MKPVCVDQLLLWQHGVYDLNRQLGFFCAAGKFCGKSSRLRFAGNLYPNAVETGVFRSKYVILQRDQQVGKGMPVPVYVIFIAFFRPCQFCRYLLYVTVCKILLQRRIHVKPDFLPFACAKHNLKGFLLIFQHGKSAVFFVIVFRIRKYFFKR